MWDTERIPRCRFSPARESRPSGPSPVTLPSRTGGILGASAPFIGPETFMDVLRKKKGFICDMDGVIYHGNALLPGVREFVLWLSKEKKNYLFLTNSSQHTPKELQQKLARMGLDVDESHLSLIHI